MIAIDKIVGNSSENIIPIEADVTDEGSVISAFEKVKEITDKLYGIIHFAGVYMLDSLVEVSTHDFDKIFNVNLRGVYLINKIFLSMSDIA